MKNGHHEWTRKYRLLAHHKLYNFVAHGRKYVSEILGFEASKSEGQQKSQACVRSCPIFPIPPNWL